MVPDPRDRLVEQLREAREGAEAARVARNKLLSAMIHDLRTPLNVILGFAQLLQDDKMDPLSDRHKERVDRIVRGGEQLQRLIEEAVEASRLEAAAESMSTGTESSSSG